jgi:DNA-binding transcriptional ArsR family regulator
VDQVLQALSSARRRQILGLVRWRERSAGEIHRALGGVTFGAVSQHLGQLEQAGLVSARREGRSRIYAARPRALVPLRRWLDELWWDGLARLKALAEHEEEAPAHARGGEPGGGRAAGGTARGHGPRRARRGHREDRRPIRPASRRRAR